VPTITPATKNSTTHRRERGSYYTPPAIVRAMLGSCLQPLLVNATADDRLDLRVLDPACGDGAFLLAAFDVMESWYRSRSNTYRIASLGPTMADEGDEELTAAQRLQIVRRHLFGVDIDRAAVARLVKRLGARIAARPNRNRAVAAAIRANIRHADALTGPDWHTAQFPHASQCGTVEAVLQRGDAQPLDWKKAFGNVSKQGGFDVIIGNPPYRRELNAKALFDRLERTELGRKWRQARMDLWYYFLHRSLDLVRPGGAVSFIVNSYWTSSTGAGKLIDRLERETEIEEVVLLGDGPIFDDVSGRHMIFRLQKRAAFADANRSLCRVTDLSDRTVGLDVALEELAKTKWAEAESPVKVASPRDANRSAYNIPQGSLIHHGQLLLGRPRKWLTRLENRSPLEELYEVRQGMAENPPSISRRIATEFGERYRVGEGVFVLTAAELAALELSEEESLFVRPYYQTSAVGRYRLPPLPSHFVLYLTRYTAPTVEHCPQIVRHLERFRPILERRRETQRGTVKWWQLHWPRAERIFTEPRILSVQMSRRPTFAHATRSTFVGFSLNLILSRCEASPPLTVLTAILNSKLADEWFAQHAKRRGVRLELNGCNLKRFPLPPRCRETEAEISRLAIFRQELKEDDIPKSSDANRAIPTDGAKSGMGRTAERSRSHGVPSTERLTHELLESRIDELVCRLYGVSPDELSPVAP